MCLFWFVFLGLRRESLIYCLLSVLSGESHVIHIAIHSTSCEETSGVEKICWWLWRGWWWWAEWSGGKVVWKSSEKLGQEAKENGTAGWAWEGNYHSELQYKMCDDTKVSAVVFEIVTTTEEMTKWMFRLACEQMTKNQLHALDSLKLL